MKRNKFTTFDWVIYILVGLFSLLCLYPFLLVVGGSLSNDSDLLKYGFKVIPKNPTLAAYKAMFMQSSAILNGYKITTIVTSVGTIGSLIFNSMMAFVISRQNFKARKFFNILVLIPILFNGGMVPWYIVCVRYLHLKDTIWALILPMMANGWYIFLMRNFFNSVPQSLYEVAKIEGAGDFLIFRKIYFQLSKPMFATLGLFTCLGYWNDWWLGMMLVDDTSIQPLQLLLRNIISNLQFLQSMNTSPELQKILIGIPGEALKMTMVIITIGPMILVYPLLQKHFVKGIMVGAVKG